MKTVDEDIGADIEYSDDLISFLEIVWGEGYLSPGGAEEVARVLEGLDLTGKKVLDLGCGSGGIALSFVADHGAKSVTGVDVQAPVLAKGRDRAQSRGLAGSVEFVQVSPGPLPFPEGSFDLVFSKDAIIHIPDKEALFVDVHRILRPGGWFAASDWLISHDGEPSPEMKHYIEMEELSFGMASPDRYARALKDADFKSISLRNRNEWYRGVAEQELTSLKGSLYDPAVAAVGKEMVDHSIGTWTAMLVVLGTGEHCPHHLRAQKAS